MAKDPLSNIPTSVEIPPTGARFQNQKLMPRGTLGRLITVSANHYNIQSLPTVKVSSTHIHANQANVDKVYQYDIRMRVPPGSQRRGDDKVSAAQQAKVMMSSQNFFGPNFVFDNVSTGWSATELFPVGEYRDHMVILPGHTEEKPNQVEIRVRNSGKLNIRELVAYLENSGLAGIATKNPDINDCFRAINALYRQDAAARFLSHPKSSAFFIRTPGLRLLLQSTGGILEALRGVFQTVSFAFNTLSLNVDTACTAFYVPDLRMIDVARAFAGVPPNADLRSIQISPNLIQDLDRMVGMFFRVDHLGPAKKDKRFRVQRISETDALTTTFEERDQATGATHPTNVAAYFFRKYKKTLEYPKLPLLITRVGAFPMELCITAPGERYREPLQGQEVR